MGPFGKKPLSWSLALHAALLAGIAVAGYLTFSEPEKPPEELLVDFTVAVPPQSPDAPESPPDPPPEPTPPAPSPPPEPVPPPPEPDPEPVPAVVETPKQPEPPPKPRIQQPSEIKIGRLVRNPVRQQPQPANPRPVKPVRTRQLDAGSSAVPPPDWSERLDAGARPGPVTTDPDADERCRRLIRSQLREKWSAMRPVLPPGQSRWPSVRLSLGSGGRVTAVRLLAGSGNAELDAAAVRAADSVKRFSGLSDAFIQANPTVDVDFKLMGGSS